MGFKRTPSPTFTAPVVVNVANEAGGFDRNTFNAKFKRPMEEDERKELLALSNEALVRRQLIGWDMKDEDTKEDVPFSPAELNACLAIDPTPMATAQAFWNALAGAHAKN